MQVLYAISRAIHACSVVKNQNNGWKCDAFLHTSHEIHRWFPDDFRGGQEQNQEHCSAAHGPISRALSADSQGLTPHRRQCQLPDVQGATD